MKQHGFEVADADRMVVSTRIRAGRSIQGFRLPPAASRAERREMERLMMRVLSKLPGDLAGRYHPLNVLSSVEAAQLRDEHQRGCWGE